MDIALKSPILWIIVDKNSLELIGLTIIGLCMDFNLPSLNYELACWKARVSVMYFCAWVDNVRCNHTIIVNIANPVPLLDL